MYLSAKLLLYKNYNHYIVPTIPSACQPATQCVVFARPVSASVAKQARMWSGLNLAVSWDAISYLCDFVSYYLYALAPLFRLITYLLS